MPAGDAGGGGAAGAETAVRRGCGGSGQYRPARVTGLGDRLDPVPVRLPPGQQPGRPRHQPFGRGRQLHPARRPPRSGAGPRPGAHDRPGTRGAHAGSGRGHRHPGRLRPPRRHRRQGPPRPLPQADGRVPRPARGGGERGARHRRRRPLQRQRPLVVLHVPQQPLLPGGRHGRPRRGAGRPGRCLRHPRPHRLRQPGGPRRDPGPAPAGDPGPHGRGRRAPRPRLVRHRRRPGRRPQPDGRPAGPLRRRRRAGRSAHFPRRRPPSRPPRSVRRRDRRSAHALPGLRRYFRSGGRRRPGGPDGCVADGRVVGH